LNYQRIYDLFILDRRRFENETLVAHKSRTRSAERHHIIPRCAGGSDDVENLIYLTLRDHWFAHNLLARIYDEHEDKAVSLGMWRAVLIIGGKGNALTSGLRLISSRLISTANSHVSKLSSGLASANADQTKYDFRNLETGEITSMARVEMVAEYDLHPNSVNALVWGTRKSANGWALASTPDEDVGRLSGDKHWKFDPTEYEFRKIGTDIVIEATKFEMAHEHKVMHGQILNLLEGRIKSTFGWTLPEISDEECGHQSGSLHPQADTRVYQFKNIHTTEEITATRWAMIDEYGFSREEVKRMIETGTCLVTGWVLNAHYDAAVSRLNCEHRQKDKGVYEFRNIHTGERLIETRKGISDCLGIPRHTINNMKARRGASTCGWVFAENYDDAVSAHLNLDCRQKDKSGYRLEGPDGQVIEGTRRFLSEASGLPRDRINMLVRGSQKATRCGWRLANGHSMQLASE
jgi:hypothetical protein